MIEIGFVFVVWSVKGNHRDKEDKSQGDGTRWQGHTAEPAHTKGGQRGG